MRLDQDAVREALADAWERWSAATRCRPWDVRGLVAHLCPDRSLFDMFNAAKIDEPGAVTDAAEMLRLFNAHGASPTRRRTTSENGPPPREQRSHLRALWRVSPSAP